MERQTHQGLVRGNKLGASYCFKGVPYAASLTLATRFISPQPPVNHPTTTLNCSEFGPSCPQPSDPSATDCLTLNIWTPEDERQKHPVLFWIHGGGFYCGSGADYNGQKMCEESNLVIVTINYRLSVLGFTNWASVLDDPEHFHSNVGIRDQLQALRWVWNNIAFFNGNPAEITVAGQSAGSTSVGLLMTLKDVQRISKSFIMQGGSLNLCITKHKSTQLAQLLLQSVLRLLTKESRKLSLPPSFLDTYKAKAKQALTTKDYSALSSLILEMPTEVLLKAATRSQSERNGQFPGSPWWDQNVLPADVHEALSQLPVGPDVRLLIGHNGDETRVWRSCVAGYECVPMTQSTLRPMLAGLPDKVVGLYDLNVPDGWHHLSNDIVFVNPCVRMANEMVARGIKVYRYRIERLEEGPLAAHCDDLNVFWSLLETDTTMWKTMRGLWGAFVAGSLQGWPQYDKEHKLLMQFDNGVEVREAPETFDKTDAWKEFELTIMS